MVIPIQTYNTSIKNICKTMFLSSRKHNVSSLALIPTWTPFSAAKYAEELLYFSMRLMTGG